MTTNVISLGSMDQEDETYAALVEAVSGENERAVFLIERKDGSVVVGTNSTDRRDIVYDLYRLQEVCRMMIGEAE